MGCRRCKANHRPIGQWLTMQSSRPTGVSDWEEWKEWGDGLHRVRGQNMARVVADWEEWKECGDGLHRVRGQNMARVVEAEAMQQHQWECHHRGTTRGVARAQCKDRDTRPIKITSVGGLC